MVCRRIRRYAGGVLASLCATVAPAMAQTQNSPIGTVAASGVRAVRAITPPVIDGQLTDGSWALAPPFSKFTQRDPDEGKPPSHPTEVRFLFDDGALYVGARMFESEPSRITRRMSARDGSADADLISIYLDTMHDRLTGAIFRVSAANVQQDSILYNDTWTDGSWDAVWESAVSVNDDGWTAEIRIPFSQLRFAPGTCQTWGVNVERLVRRTNESSWLAMVPKAENHLASRMLDLTGLEDLKPMRRLELLPYVAGRTDFVQAARGNPFNDGARTFASTGVDLKWGVTNNLTINATANPDFGQVEVDPAVVNLTAFETFFQEKRPFFLEGSQIFNNYGRLGANDFWGFNNSSPQLFYSRRIGRAPQLTASGDYIDAPSATTILGAVKLTGKTTSGWSLGLLNAVTSEESASTSTAGVGGRDVVEPLSNYTVVRLQRDVGKRWGFGLLTTAVNRQLPDARLRDGLARGAYVYGADAYWFVDKGQVWALNGNVAGSTVLGTAAVIDRLQRAPQRYLQRPDEPHVHYDPTRTSLSGFTGRLNLNRNQGKYWRVNAALWAGSPEFESNDLGFHGTGDRAGAHGVFLVRNTQPTRWSRQWSAWAAKWWTWNYAKELQGDGWNAQGYWQFLNYWNVNGDTGTRRRVLDDRLTRGGPVAASPGGGFWNVNLNSDSRRRLSFGWNINADWSDAGAYSRNTSAGVTLKPTTRIIVSLSPAWSRQHRVAQYVTTAVDPTAAATFGSRYVFAGLEQRQLSMQTRVSVIVTPRVSFQLFMQPLLATGDYGGFKELAQPRTFDFLRFGDGASRLDYDASTRTYTADPDGAGGAAPSFTFNDPDFNIKSLRLNAVFRWEFKPGSTFYAVWTRRQEDSGNPGVFSPGRDARAMLGAPGDDIVLFKMAYWMGK